MQQQLQKHGFAKADVDKADASVVTLADNVPTLKVKATVDGASPSDAQDKKFQTALQATVAAATGLAPTDVVIVGTVAVPCGQDDDAIAPAPPQAALPLLLFNHQRRKAYTHGCGGVVVEYLVHDTARTDTDLLKRIVESKTVAANVETALTDAGYKGVAVGDAEAVVVDVVAPTPAPSSPIYCPEYRLRYGADDPKYLALCAPTAAPTPAPKVAVTVALKGATEKKCNVGKAAGGAVANALGVNAADVTVVASSADEVTLLVDAENYGLDAQDVEKELKKAEGGVEDGMAAAGCGKSVKVVDVDADVAVVGPPTKKPTAKPTRKPTHKPTHKPTAKPTRKPTHKPSHKPTHKPSHKPTHKPSHKPSHKPTAKPQEVHHHTDDEPAPLPIW